MNRLVKTLAVSTLALSLIVGVVGVSSAADPTPTPAPKTTEWQPGPMGGRGFGQGAGPGFQAIAGPVAQLLGMTAADIQAQRQAGKSLVEIAAAKGVDEAKLVGTILAARKATLDARVKDGTLTQAQADAAYQQMQTRVKDSVNRTAVGPNRPESGLGLGYGLGPQAGYGQPGQGTGPGMFNRYGRGSNR